MAYEVHQRRTIHRPLDEVFRFMSDAENDALWRVNVKYIRRESGGGQSKVGSVYRQKLKGPFGGLTADLRYTEYVENERLAFTTIKGSVDPDATIEFAPSGEGATDVHFHLVWEPKGFWKVASPIMGRMIDKVSTASYDNLVRKFEDPSWPPAKEGSGG